MKVGITMTGLLLVAGASVLLSADRSVAAPPEKDQSALVAVDAEILLVQGDEPAPPLSPERRRERIRRLREELRRLEADQPGEPGPGAGGGKGRGPDAQGPPGRGPGTGPGPGPGPDAAPGAPGHPGEPERPGREARQRQHGPDGEPGQRGPHAAERREEMRRRMEMMGERMQFMGRWQEAVRLPSRAVMMATHALVEIGDRSQRREATLEQLNELLTTVDAVEARTAIRFALKEIYQETGAYDKAMEQMRLVIIENAPKIADEPRPPAPRD